MSEFDYLKSENASLRGAAMGLGELCDQLKAENARYRELVEILRRDWRIEASWDDLRKVWYVGLTEDGVRERDERDAKALEAANIEIGELRELVRDMFMTFCTFRETAMTDREELRHSVRFWKKLDELGIEVEK